MRPVRLSRLRKNERVRDWIGQTNLDSKDLILPYFVVEGEMSERKFSLCPEFFVFQLMIC